jgi:hypothetical protein
MRMAKYLEKHEYQFDPEQIWPLLQHQYPYVESPLNPLKNQFKS